MNLVQDNGVASDQLGGQNLCGWLDCPDEVKEITKSFTFQQVSEVLDGLGIPKLLAFKQDDNKPPVLLYEAFRKLPNNGGKDQDWGPQLIGDCVSWGWGGLNDYAQAAAIVIGRNKLGIEFQATMTEYIYGSSRVEVGGQRGSRSDGSVGAWAAKSVAKYGCPSRKHAAKFFKDEAYGSYSGQRAKDWGANGVPDNFEPEGQLHLIKEVVMVRNFEEAAAMITLGNPVAVCSMQGFSQTRDSDGFCPTSIFPWAHCMKFIGVRYDRPALLCAQSWGQKSPTGPKWNNQPDNTFWVDARTCTSMLSREDSYSGGGIMGYTVDDALGFWRH